MNAKNSLLTVLMWLENKFDCALNFLVDERNWNCGEEECVTFDVPGGLDYCAIKIWKKKNNSKQQICRMWGMTIVY